MPRLRLLRFLLAAAVACPGLPVSAQEDGRLERLEALYTTDLVLDRCRVNASDEQRDALANEINRVERETKMGDVALQTLYDARRRAVEQRAGDASFCAAAAQTALESLAKLKS